MTRLIILVAFLTLLGMPFLFRADAPEPPEDARELIIITPHNEQIRTEFGSAFDAWHRREHGEAVNVVWNNPGGTSEIRKMLIAQYEAALRDDRPLGGSADLMFGGGSYEHSKLRSGVRIIVDGEERTSPISAPVAFSDDELDAIYGENSIGSLPLYDDDRYWFGTAVSGFGIVYNTDILTQLGVDEPTEWANLADPRLRGWLALANPGHSGSVTTAFETILHRVGWERGWQILRRAGGNARYFAGHSARPAADISLGEAAMGVSIDFYGRYQAQAIRSAGGGRRVGYVDPPGQTTIDPDPISMLRGAPHPELARRFIEFVLSDEGQSLWQYAASDPRREDGFGPRRFELRRMPVRRAMYRPEHLEHFIDQVDPFTLVEPLDDPNGNVRSFITPVFTAMTMDVHEELRAAWAAIIDHPAYPSSVHGILTASDVSDPGLAAMLELFDAMPVVSGPDGARYALDDEENLAVVKAGWLRSGWRDADLWPAEARPADELRRRFASFYRDNYRAVVAMSRDTLVQAP